MALLEYEVKSLLIQLKNLDITDSKETVLGSYSCYLFTKVLRLCFSLQFLKLESEFSVKQMRPYSYDGHTWFISLAVFKNIFIFE